MKKVFLSLMLVSAVFLVGCQAFGMPKANNIETGAWEGVASYGIATHVANQYAYAPECTNPITVLPCSKAAIRQQLRTTDDNAYKAMLNAVAAIRNAPNAGATTKAKLDADRKIKELDNLTKSDAVQSTLKEKL